MNSGRIVAVVAGANVTAIEGTKAAAAAVPFLDAHLFMVIINGEATSMTPQALIVILTALLSFTALGRSIFRKGNP
jgi:hypothetical protein